MTTKEDIPGTSPNLANASIGELHLLLEEMQQTGDRGRVEELQLQASEGLLVSRDRVALLERIVAAGDARQLHSFGSLGENNGQ
jgi:hypothetical protein